MNLKTEGHSN